MQAKTDGSTREPLTCAGCEHPIQDGQPRLSDVPENMPEGAKLEAFRPLSPELPSMSGATQRATHANASRQTAFAAQTKTECVGCGHSIAKGQDVFRDYHFVWNLDADNGDIGELSGGVAGMRPLANGPVSFNALPGRLKLKFRIAGLGNGRGIRTAAEAERFYRHSVPRSVRNMNVRRRREVSEGQGCKPRRIRCQGSRPGKDTGKHSVGVP